MGPLGAEPARHMGGEMANTPQVKRFPWSAILNFKLTRRGILPMIVERK